MTNAYQVSLSFELVSRVSRPFPLGTHGSFEFEGTDRRFESLSHL